MSKLKKMIWLGFVSLSLAANSALAADMPLKAAPFQKISSSDWGGFYVGIVGGYGWGNSNQDTSNTTTGGQPIYSYLNLPGCLPSDYQPNKCAVRSATTASGTRFLADYDVQGFSVGGTVGYGHMIAQNIFGGIEADISYSKIDGKNVVCNCGTDLNWYGTLRGRFGYVTGNTLLYGTGGLAVGGIRVWDDEIREAGTKTKLGWAAGAGIEHNLMNRWSVKLEYMHMGFGSADYFTPAGFTPVSSKLDVDMVRLGLNRKL